MRKYLLLSTLALLAVPGFGATYVFNVFLDGPSEATPVPTPGFGTSVITFDDIAKTMHVQIDFQDLVGTTTMAHIHCCTAVPFAGTVGVATELPSFTGFPLGVTSGTYDHLFDMTIPTNFGATFLANNGGTTDAALAALIKGSQDGKAYLNIHTSFRGSGEIRGFLQAVPEPGTFGAAATALAAAAFALRKRIRS